MAADGFKAFADAIEAGATPQAVAAEALKKHRRCIFNGNGYSAEWPGEAVKRGVWKIDSGVEALNKMVDPKNVLDGSSRSRDWWQSNRKEVHQKHSITPPFLT